MCIFSFEACVPQLLDCDFWAWDESVHQTCDKVNFLMPGTCKKGRGRSGVPISLSETCSQKTSARLPFLKVLDLPQHGHSLGTKTSLRTAPCISVRDTYASQTVSYVRVLLLPFVPGWVVLKSSSDFLNSCLLSGFLLNRK